MHTYICFCFYVSVEQNIKYDETMKTIQTLFIYFFLIAIIRETWFKVNQSLRIIHLAPLTHLKFIDELSVLLTV